MKIKSSLIFSFIATFSILSHAQVKPKQPPASPTGAAVIRISCEGSSKNADVEINGVFKGQCPVDIEVKAGQIAVKVFKRVDAEHERAYITEVRLAAGTVKRVDAELGPSMTAAENIEYARTAPEREQKALMEQEAQRKIEAEKIEREAKRIASIDSSWKKVKAEWTMGFSSGNGCERTLARVNQSIKQIKDFNCSCRPYTPTHPAHRMNTYERCTATFTANTVINDVTSFSDTYDFGPSANTPAQSEYMAVDR